MAASLFVGLCPEVRPRARSLHHHADRGQEGEHRAEASPFPRGDSEDKWLLLFVESSCPSYLFFKMTLGQEQD